MHVRISRTEPEAGITPRWTGQVTIAGPMPDDVTPACGARLQASIVGDDLRFQRPGGDPIVLPLTRLRSAAPVELPGGANAVALRVAGAEREAVLLVQPVISLLGRKGGRAAALLDALAGWGVPVTSILAPPMLTDPAAAAWKPIEDTVLWAGRASIPAHPWLQPQPAHVWVTTRALRWSIDGMGACQLPIDAVLAAAAAPGERHPAEAVIEYAAGGIAFALPVRFDLYGPDRSYRERGAFLVGLKSRGIRTIAGHSAPAPAAPAQAPHPLRSAPGGAGSRPGSARPRPSATGDLATAREVEAALLDDLHRLNRALASGIPFRREDGLGARLGAGLADLDAAQTRDATCRGEVETRRSRMLALAEATTRLRALIDQRERGLIDGASIDHRRQAILAPLGDILLGA